MNLIRQLSGDFVRVTGLLRHRSTTGLTMSDHRSSSCYFAATGAAGGGTGATVMAKLGRDAEPLLLAAVITMSP